MNVCVVTIVNKRAQEAQKILGGKPPQGQKPPNAFLIIL